MREITTDHTKLVLLILLLNDILSEAGVYGSGKNIERVREKINKEYGICYFRRRESVL